LEVGGGSIWMGGSYDEEDVALDAAGAKDMW